MAESQRDRAAQPEPVLRTVWTEEKRQVFLEIADKYGWNNHQLIAGVTVRQVTNFKQKFDKKRWKEKPCGPTLPTDQYQVLWQLKYCYS